MVVKRGIMVWVYSSEKSQCPRHGAAR